MDLAYPSGLASIPPKKRPYYDLDPNAPLEDFLPPAPTAACISQPISNRKDGPRGYEFRLGSVHFPHLKLRLQFMEHQGSFLWVYTVDTHDAFSRASVQPPPEHPEAQAWLALQDANRLVKDQVEDALQQAGFTTFKSLLRMDLVPQ
jgi:hypothetical protein